jgi:hypothetical protein
MIEFACLLAFASPRLLGCLGDVGCQVMAVELSHEGVYRASWHPFKLSQIFELPSFPSSLSLWIESSNY